MSFLTVLLLAGLAVGLILWFRSRRGDGPELTVAELPQAVAALALSREESAFIVFRLGRHPDSGGPDLQFSVERGRLGLDWVLLDPANVADEAKFRTFVLRRGHSIQERHENGVRTLRIEDGDLVQTGSGLLCEAYGVNVGTRLATVLEGFSLPPS